MSQGAYLDETTWWVTQMTEVQSPHVPGFPDCVDGILLGASQLCGLTHFARIGGGL